MVNFILGCRFLSKLCKSLMLPNGNSQNIDQSSRYLFNDPINSVFILLLYFLLSISYRSSGKYVNFRVAYVGAILIPMAVSRVGM